MSSPEFVNLFKNNAAAAAVFDRLRDEVIGLPAGRTLRPRVLAKQAGIPAWQALAVLRMLQEAGLGEVRVQVTDPNRDGLPLGTYLTVEEIPPTVPDALGEPFEVSPEDMQLVFVPKQGLTAAYANGEGPGDT
jgi:hypothetical protein